MAQQSYNLPAGGPLLPYHGTIDQLVFREGSAALSLDIPDEPQSSDDLPSTSDSVTAFSTRGGGKVCPLWGCDFIWERPHVLREHCLTAHPCPHCEKRFDTLHKLGGHGIQAKHAVFLCPFEGCRKAFDHTYSLRRHCEGHTGGPRYPCPHCPKYRGQAGFKRKDHLTQHLRGYHHIDEHRNSQAWACPHVGCADSCYREGAFNEIGLPKSFSAEDARAVFRSSAEFQKHMRKVHDESPFECRALNCERRAGKGYFRGRDLEKHQQKEHPEEAETLRRTMQEWSNILPKYFGIRAWLYL